MIEDDLESFVGLTEARTRPDVVAIFEGDYGGQIYAVARVSYIECGEERLRSLLGELDALGWDDPDGASLYFESSPAGCGIAGGMGGAEAPVDVWVHPELGIGELAIRAVLRGERESVLQ
jgi:hypothetical protein